MKFGRRGKETVFNSNKFSLPWETLHELIRTELFLKQTRGKTEAYGEGHFYHKTTLSNSVK